MKWKTKPRYVTTVQHGEGKSVEYVVDSKAPQPEQPAVVWFGQPQIAAVLQVVGGASLFCGFGKGNVPILGEVEKSIPQVFFPVAEAFEFLDDYGLEGFRVVRWPFERVSV